jgi:hypothetical protein
MSCKRLINPITNLNPVAVSNTRDSMIIVVYEQLLCKFTYTCIGHFMNVDVLIRWALSY